MALTNTAVNNAKPSSKTQRLFDGRGLYLEISPSGGKWWRLKYRFGGKEKRISLGVYPEISLKEARERREAARKLLANNIDPSEARKAGTIEADLAENASFEQVTREWFAKYEPSWSKSHAVRIIRRFERDIFPWLGSRDIGQIKAPELLEAVQRIESRGAVETAHRALSNCGQVFRYAVATSRADRDIATDLKGALSPVNPQHFASITEPAKVAEMLRAIEAYQGTLTVKSALRLSPLVFVRPGELRHALWADIDFDAAEWRFKVSKTKSQHIVPLATQAVSILEELHPLTRRSKFVFPGARSASRPMSENAVLAALRRMGFTNEEMTGHGFRAMARTILDEELGFRADFIEHQLAHAVRDPLGRAYNRTTHLEERRKMMQGWADYLDGLGKKS